jgi:hypothetical protein
MSYHTIAVMLFLAAMSVALPVKSAARDTIDASSIDRKLLMGYQGWFACPGDSSPPNRWVHWFRSQTPIAANATFDIWPDLREFGNDELFATQMRFPKGDTAKLYGAYKEKSVVRHFKWMKDYDLDGVFLQRFLSECTNDPAFFRWRNHIIQNVRKGAESYGRVFAVMYDISGATESSLVPDLLSDWKYLVDSLKVTGSNRYLRQGGKPVVAIWGLGFTGRPGTPAMAQAIIDSLKNGGDVKYHATVFGGVPAGWRTLSGDSKTEAAWAAVYRSFDMVSPWAVGRFADDAGANNYLNNFIKGDLAEAQTDSISYMPVIFPGFSWKNLNNGVLNQIPRRAGNFYWRQVYNAVANGCTMLYGAMFDEVDEGTAMFKLSPSAASTPNTGSWVTLDIDGTNLPSDWYLQLASAAGKMLRGETSLSAQIPISPTMVSPSFNVDKSSAPISSFRFAVSQGMLTITSLNASSASTIRMYQQNGRLIGTWLIRPMKKNDQRRIEIGDISKTGIGIVTIKVDGALSATSLIARK